MKIELPHNHGDSKLVAQLNKAMPEKENFQIVADIFKMLDDPTRLQIFWVLCHVEECVINLASLLNISSPALSHHLKLLKAEKLIISRRDGKEVYYKAAETEAVRMMHHAVEQIMKISCPERQTAACHHNDTLSESLSESEKTIHVFYTVISQDELVSSQCSCRSLTVRPSALILEESNVTSTLTVCCPFIRCSISFAT